MTNEELQWAINDALDNVIKTEDYIKGTALTAPTGQKCLHGFVEQHLKNLLDVQIIRAQFSDIKTGDAVEAHITLHCNIDQPLKQMATDAVPLFVKRVYVARTAQHYINGVICFLMEKNVDYTTNMTTGVISFAESAVEKVRRYGIGADYVVVAEYTYELKE
jgi:hypothetical protein